MAAEGLADLDRGRVSAGAFSDEQVYRDEQDRVFEHTWLFVGHESSIPEPGDYITNYMGEDSVIVLRGADRQPRVFLNKCLHRGNQVCLFDRGQAKTFTCSFHGWQFDIQGKLVGVPFFDTAYQGQLERDELRLVEPRVETYGGMVFACWDADIMPLRDYLGEFTWYLDRLLIHDCLGGMQVVGGRQ
ncbi:MAG TPA: Rieske 2Fe-2S domain-containing protein, partial [Chloroflexota bacterium]|nr:Rieske 2Fe-2S domain-containing protein [Chloroflexota bacterium]